MTTKGFIDFVTSRSELRQSVQLNKTRVLFDGHMLQRCLYQLSSGRTKDYKYCTDYVSYADCIKSFLRRLKICDIVPIVVFHGAINPKKYVDSFEDRMREIGRIYRSHYDNVRFQSPTLCNYVFGAVMREFKVDLIQTCSSTWPQVAMLANALQCPVYSYRNDFFFLELKFGLLFNDSLLKSKLHFDQQSKSWYLSAQVLHLNHLSETYTGLKPEVLPLLAAVWDRSLKFQISERVYNRLVEKTHQWGTMDDILHWIKGKSVDKALNEITEYLQSCEDGNEEVDVKIKSLMKRFEASDSLLSQYFTDSESEKDSLKMLAKGDIEVVVPNWFAREYRKAIIRPAMMNIVKMKLHVLYPQLEDFDQSSGYECTLTLRLFLYGILRTETANSPDIKVLDRIGTKKLVEMVTPPTHLSESRHMPYLGNVRLLSINERRELFLSVLEVTESFINRCKITLLMSEFFDRVSDLNGATFMLIILRYWIRQDKDLEWKPFVSAMILSIMYYSRQELSSDPKWSDLHREDLKSAIDPRVVHHFAQIQACLHMSNFINIVLGFPFDEGKVYFCLNGIFLYNATRIQSDKRKGKELIEKLFQEREPMEELYEEMIQMVVFDLNV